MRNIKTTLRTVRNSALLFAAASGMTYLTACQETEVLPTDLEENVEVSTLGLKVGTNPDLAKTYYNSHMGTRAAFDVPEHPGMPTEIPTSFDLTLDDTFAGNEWALYVYLPASTPSIDLSGMGVEEGEEWGNKVYYLNSPTVLVPAKKYKCLPAEFRVIYKLPYYDNNPGWTKEEKTVIVKTPKYYINGAVTCGGFGQNGKLEIHILNGGSLSAEKEFEYDNVVYLYKGGKLLRSRNENEIYLKNTVYAEENISDDNVNIIMDSAKVYTYGKIHGKNVSTINNTELYAGCAVTAVEKIYLTNQARICAGYVSAPNVKLDSSAKVLLRDGAYLYASEMLDLENIGNDCQVLAEEGEYAMIETKTIKVNLIDLQGSFFNLAVKFDNATGDNRTGEHGEGLNWNESVMVNGDIVYDVVDGDDCGPKMVVMPTEPDLDPELENIGSVAPADGHEHPISATCIYTNGQDAYLSWHTQGGLFHGCIEYLTVANGTVTLNGYLETNPAGQGDNNIDFNHVIFDNGNIFVAGDHQKKGGIVGWIPCNNGGFVTGDATLNLRQLYKGEGGSGNCIIRNGNHYQIASIKGFETFNVADFTNGGKPKAIAALDAYNFDPAQSEGKSTGKHIATDGNKVVMLTLINRDDAANTANASIKVYNASDVNYENEVASYVINDQVLAPVDGKDVIAISGDDIWVCLGRGGVQHLKLAGNTISKVSEFVLKNKSKEELKGWEMTPKEAAVAGANGLAVDGKYVYVAHGGAGLVVLNKEDLSFVTRTRNNGGNSANYINLNPDGYIYVAYGKSNVQVYAWKKN